VGYLERAQADLEAGTALGGGRLARVGLAAGIIGTIELVIVLVWVAMYATR
jgi:hypothetical protein